MCTKTSAVLIFAISFSAISMASAAPELKASFKSSLSSMPLPFTENQGQWPDSILYRASAGGATMWFTPTSVYYQFTRTILKQSDQTGALSADEHLYSKFKAEPDSIEITMIRAEFVGAELSPATEGIGLMDYKCNYFIGNEPDKWRTDVSNYESIVYREVYSGIDLKYYGNGRQMEYDFIVSPGADYSKIQIRYHGAESLTLGENGELIIKVANGEIIEQPPVVYQIVEGRKVNIDCNYVISEENTFSFKVDDRYNPAHELVIDPILVYSTYLGGNAPEFGYGIAVDSDGAAYVAGFTSSVDFPIFNPYQEIYIGNFQDAFVTKLSSNGSSLIYSTYFGGYGNDITQGIALDAAGAVYVAGYTNSQNFPTLNAYQAIHGGGYTDVFVFKLNNAGNNLLYSTYLGGSSGDWGYAISVDADGQAYVTGQTTSDDFPTQNPYQGTLDVNGRDAFVTKFSSAGNSLVYSTYLGGSAADVAAGIAVDAAGAAYVTGYTESTDFPTQNPYQGTYNGGSRDAFVTKLSSSGNNLVYSTYLGGSNIDGGLGIAVDADGVAHVTGGTTSTDFPTQFPYQGTNQGGLDIFVTKLTSQGNFLIYSTYLGGSNNDVGAFIGLNDAGAVYVAGQTFSDDFPLVNPTQTNQLHNDV
ncbi:MAG: SBBP repeat-containing protein, partial [candidate division Zixibacteria bacterium]|nr:SBBP repeat-containing protein [candidate division Zixibacteria bacterium]